MDGRTNHARVSDEPHTTPSSSFLPFGSLSPLPGRNTEGKQVNGWLEEVC